MNVYQVDEANYYAGNTGAEALAAYLADVGEDEGIREGLAEFGEPELIADDRLDTLRIVDIDEPGHPTKTFREALAERDGKPGFIGTTEY